MLKGKQKRQLRGLAVNLDPIFQIGKGGINDNLIKQLSDVLDTRELIKVRLLNNSDEEIKEVAEKISADLKAELIQIIGHVIVLYRFSTKDKVDHIEVVGDPKTKKKPVGILVRGKSKVSKSGKKAPKGRKK